MTLRATLQRIISVAFLLALFGVYAQAQRLTVVGWNLESGGSSISAIAERVRRFQGVDLWGLSEVAGDATLKTFEAAAEDGENADFHRLISLTGCGDRLGIVFNAARLEILRAEELHQVTYNADEPPPGRCQRSPLVADFRDNRSKRRFLFVVNHLERGDLRLRRDQAQRLNEWVRTQTLPVIATGHYNFDWSVANGDRSHDAGFDRMVNGDHWAWVRPKTLVKTQCGPNNNRILDFVFVNVSARPFALTSEIIQEVNDCGNAMVNPDHRPVKAEFDFIGPPSNQGAAAPANQGIAAPANQGPTKAELLQRIEALERQILELKALIQRSP
jgi:endonuclease/exonuclease/phosphatase family metal-dependent hydrolase